MKGIVRKIDELGRITLPMEYRKTFGVEVGENAPAVMHLTGNVMRIELKPEKAVGLVRFLDGLGRLTLPIEVRRTLGFEDRQKVDMWVEGEEICLRKDGKVCVFCGCNHVESLTEYKGLYICDTCLLELETGL